MDKEFLIKLTKEIYRLTLLFPKKEPLRYKMREIADNILAYSREEDFQILDSFFEVAKSQNWVKNSEISSLQEEYQKLKNQSLSIAPKIQKDETSVQTKRESLNQRQEKILEILKEKGRAQVWEVQKIFPNVSKRTLRRDFRSLLKRGLIERKGERNATFYQIKSQDLLVS